MFNPIIVVLGLAMAVPCMLASGTISTQSSGVTGDIIALVALTVMEIVLGIDNIIFISIMTGKLPVEQQARARFIGLALAMGIRILLLCFIAWIVGWVEPIFHLSDFAPSFLQNWLTEREEINSVSVRDLILIGGGLFLVRQSVVEIHHHIEGEHDDESSRVGAKKLSFTSVIIQILLLDIVFSLDSVITAVGMADNIYVMVTAVVVAVIVMMVFSGPVSSFVMKHPSIKMLALSFLLMIGVMLLAEGGGTHFNKNYIYFSMAFALIVELLNLRASVNRKKASQKTA